MRRNATKVGVVLVEVLLSVAVDVAVCTVAVNSVAILQGWDLACRERLCQLRHAAGRASEAGTLVVGPERAGEVELDGLTVVLGCGLTIGTTVLIVLSCLRAFTESVSRE